MKRFYVPALLTLTLVLTACSATATPPQTNLEPAPASTNDSPSNLDSLTRTDDQGAIIFEVTPLDLTASTNTLVFDIVLSTHSIDLSMDLAPLSTLATDTGVTLTATTWDAPRGGHHVAGKLIFPVIIEGKPILEGATKLTLTIVDVDALARTFEWELK